MSDERQASEVPDAPMIETIRRVAARHEVHTLAAGTGSWAAAVLIAILPYDDPQVVLTVRSQHVEYHKGEMSFPGGALDAGEAPVDGALREADEEVGIRAEHVEVLGEQSHYRTITDFHVIPFVGLLDRAPYPFRPLEIEVAEVITPSFSHLLDPANTKYEEREREDGTTFKMREYWFEGHRIFGATATMLGRLLDEVAAELAMEGVSTDG